MARVLLFGRLQDVAGWRARDYDPCPPSASALRARLAAEDPMLGAALSAASIAFVLNGVVRKDDPEISPGDEAAFLPPMSGG
jgi:molybdopterin synthase sulfur carrier subunit